MPILFIMLSIIIIARKYNSACGRLILWIQWSLCTNATAILLMLNLKLVGIILESPLGILPVAHKFVLCLASIVGGQYCHHFVRLHNFAGHRGNIVLAAVDIVVSPAVGHKFYWPFVGHMIGHHSPPFVGNMEDCYYVPD